MRYYERAGLVQPVQRQDSSGHRRCSMEHITKLQTLACLRAAGMSLDQMRLYEELLQEGDAVASRQGGTFRAAAAALEEENGADAVKSGLLA